MSEAKYGKIIVPVFRFAHTSYLATGSRERRRTYTFNRTQRRRRFLC
nr:hypothetical protein [Coxiella burnetii]